MNRRKLIGGIGLLVAAPAIVKASSLMKVKTWDTNPCADVLYYTNEGAYTLELRVASENNLVLKSQHPLRLNYEGAAVVDVRGIDLKPGDRVQIVVHDDRCEPLFKSMVVGEDYRPTVIQKGVLGWREL